MRQAEYIHPKLPAMKSVNGKTGEYAGECPFCNGGDDRFHVWTKAGGGKPAWRYWCRICEASGLVNSIDRENDRPIAPVEQKPHLLEEASANAPVAEHISYYRKLYAEIMVWAHAWLLDDANPAPVGALKDRGISQAAIEELALGYALNDPYSLMRHLEQQVPDLMRYAEEAGILAVDRISGNLCVHWNLRGVLIFPYIVNGETVDIRTRKLGKGEKTRSLPGSPIDRGAVYPMGWEQLRKSRAKTVILTESGEHKCIVPLSHFINGNINTPTIGQPGLNNFKPEWAQALIDLGVETVIIAYDSQTRKPNKKTGRITLAPEERQTLINGSLLQEAGLNVRVLRLPLKPGQEKQDLDGFILADGPGRFQQLIDEAPKLYDYHASIPSQLLKEGDLPSPINYPTRRARPAWISRGNNTPIILRASDQEMQRERENIQQIAEDHASTGQGCMVLAHQPGAGKGHNTTEAIKIWLRTYRDPNGNPPTMLWSALRKDQINDQKGLNLIPLSGRNQQNCRELAKAQELSKKGYNVREGLCMRRCPHVNRCTYLKQFDKDANHFATIPLMLATNWWSEKNLIVLDEFDVAKLINNITLSLSDMMAMHRSTNCVYARSVLRWLMTVQATTVDRTLNGIILYQAMDAEAEKEQLRFGETLIAAVDALPDEMLQATIPGLQTNATLKEYENLPPGHLARLLKTMLREYNKRIAGQTFTSRVEAKNGMVRLHLLHEHLRDELARDDQPKIILDANANESLFRAIFPKTTIRYEKQRIPTGANVIQVIGQDWAKSTLHDPARRDRWFTAVASHIQPGHKTLIVCTMEYENELRQALASRGYTNNVVVAHYNGLRGSNEFKGYDVILAQVFNPLLSEIISEGRAIFADDSDPLDEIVIANEQIITDSTGAAVKVTGATFRDPRLAALLRSRREAEMYQCALRGRPLDHDIRITIMSNLSIEDLQPTQIIEDQSGTPESNEGRRRNAIDKIAKATETLVAQGVTTIDVDLLASTAGSSVVTVRKYLEYIPSLCAHLTIKKITHLAPAPNGGVRSYEKTVLAHIAQSRPRQRGRAVPSKPSAVTTTHSRTTTAAATIPAKQTVGGKRKGMTDHARNNTINNTRDPSLKRQVYTKKISLFAHSHTRV